VAPPVLAVIPTFRPPDSVADLVQRLANQAQAVAVIDDASPCTSDRLLADLGRHGDVVVLRNLWNAGIARSLNQGLRLARERGLAWLLTVDQDSMVPEHLVPRLLEAVRSPHIGVIAPEAIEDASGSLRYPSWHDEGNLLTHEVFQTGALWSVDALASVGGFDERLAMDAVDAAACLRLRGAGFLVALAPGLSLTHRVGSARQVRVLGRSILVSNHSPERRYSIVRNRLRLAPAEFRQSPLHAARTLRRMIVQSALSVTVEHDRRSKMRAIIRAISPGRRRMRA